MTRHSRVGHLRLTTDRFELWLVSEHHEVVDITLPLDAKTAGALRRAAASPCGQHARDDAGALLVRSLQRLGVADPRLEVRYAEPTPRFVLVMPGPWEARELDLDLVEATSVIVGRQMPVVARGWPRRDWDALLATAANDAAGSDSPQSDRA